MPSLKIDLATGLLEAEGSEEFLRSMFSEFRSLGISGPKKGSNSPQSFEPQVDTPDSSRKPAKRARRKSAGATEKMATPPSNYVPTVKKSLNFPGLKEFISSYDLKTHPEKILAFSMFLRDHMSIYPIEADDIFTAYRFAQIKPAGAFLQSIRDTSHKKTWVDYQSPTDIKVTPLGETHFLHDLPKKSEK